MLTIPRRKFIEKIVTSPEGIDFKVVFLVYEEGGKIKGKIVSATPITSVDTESLIALPGNVDAVLHELILSTFTKESISPYIDFNFFVSQPTRAPSIV